MKHYIAEAVQTNQWTGFNKSKWVVAATSAAAVNFSKLGRGEGRRLGRDRIGLAAEMIDDA